MKGDIAEKPRLTLRGAFLLFALLSCLPSAVQAAPIDKQRHWFTQAHQALQSGQLELFASLKSRLAGYPLTPYLDIWQTWKRLGEGHDAEVASVLERYADIPEAHDLRKAWVKDLARRGRWSRVARQLAAHPRLERRLPGIAIMADWHTDKRTAAIRRYSEAWMHATRLHGVSRELRKAWRELGHPSTNERWARIVHTGKQGRWSQVRALSRQMGKRQKGWLAYWHRLHNNPASAFPHWPASLSRSLPAHAKLVGAMISDGLYRQARSDPEQAHANLHRLRKQPHDGIDDGFYDTLEQKISLAAAKRHLPMAAGWLANLPAAQHTIETRAWQARLSLLQRNWPALLHIIGGMPDAQQRQDRWQYWKAYALEREGYGDQARPIFNQLAGNRSYYGFLSAAHLDLPYRFGNEPLNASPEEMARLMRLPGVLRAREWLALKRYHKAEREWYSVLSGSDVKAWKAAAAIATTWHWPGQAIRAANRAGAENALEARFPLPYGKLVSKTARATGLNPSSIWGVIRQESFFNRRAHSRKGARGLMQLMPRTARRMAKRMGMRANRKALYSPAINIRLGTHYLAGLKARFNNNLVLAAAAYNAGPNKVGRWLDRTPFDSAEAWVETIPYRETRRYVQHVMAFTIVYQWRENRQPTDLSELMNSRTREFSLNEVSN